jgi:hypothetical protein
MASQHLASLRGHNSAGSAVQQRLAHLLFEFAQLLRQALALGAPLLVALVLCYVIGVGSAFASSTALLTAFIPLAGSPLRRVTGPIALPRKCGSAWCPP